MSSIERVVESEGEQPDYSSRQFSAVEVEQGAHRAFIGGVWESHGQRQVDFLVSRGLLPQHRLLDIGCGPFRAGRLFVDYLEPEHYYGVDANQSLLQAGYDLELTDGQRLRLPTTNLRATDRFDVDFGVQVDYALAQSVFTHVSLNHIRLCLYRAAKVVRPGGSFYATFFERGRSTPLDSVLPSKRDKPFFTEKNVYWYYRGDLTWAAGFSPWAVNYIGDWGHPAKQKMVEFVRLPDGEPEARPASRPSPPPLRDELARFARRGRAWARRRRAAGG